MWSLIPDPPVSCLRHGGKAERVHQCDLGDTARKKKQDITSERKQTGNPHMDAGQGTLISILLLVSTGVSDKINSQSLEILGNFHFTIQRTN